MNFFISRSPIVALSQELLASIQTEINFDFPFTYAVTSILDALTIFFLLISD